jgi:seryl-tRNA(Sec) selenium transferase
LYCFGGKFFDSPDPALIIVGRKSIIEGENLIFLRVSTITRKYRSVFYQLILGKKEKIYGLVETVKSFGANFFVLFDCGCFRGR